MPKEALTLTLSYGERANASVGGSPSRAAEEKPPGLGNRFHAKRNREHGGANRA